MPVDVAFKPLKEALTDQELFILTDFGKFDRPAQIHLAYLTMHEYRKRNGGGLPRYGFIKSDFVIFLTGFHIFRQNDSNNPNPINLTNNKSSLGRGASRTPTPSSPSQRRSTMGTARSPSTRSSSAPSPRSAPATSTPWRPPSAASWHRK